jgi:3,4-dihydroxy 2-butanone 4-phosphate synthase/GTP cyclohydrolase II
VLASRGRGEAAADLAGLAGLHPAAALAAVVGTTDATDLARGPELADFAREHGLRLLSIGDLATYRVQFERLVERGAEAVMPLPAGTFTAVGFRGRVDGREHLALVRGEIADGADVLVRVHRECPLGDLLGSTACGCGARLRAALAAIAEQGRGIVVYLRSGRQQLAALGDAHGCGVPPAVRDQIHDAAVGAQILRELGVRNARSLTGPHPWCAAAQP